VSSKVKSDMILLASEAR